MTRWYICAQSAGHVQHLHPLIGSKSPPILLQDQGPGEPQTGLDICDVCDADGPVDLSRDLLLLGVNCMVNRREPLDVGVQRSKRVGVSIIPRLHFLMHFSPGQPT